MRVLLVEDSDPLRQLFARFLKCRGIDVHQAADGREALDALPDFSPDLVLTDLMMPVIDGFELIRRLRAMPALADVPLVAMSAGTSSEAEHQARMAGAADFIPKPIDFQTLVDRICGHFC